jgi:hypothetical protein
MRQSTIRKASVAGVLLATVLVAPPLHAFQIFPNKTPNDSRLANLAGFLARVSNKASDRFLGVVKAPVHEAIVHAAFGCNQTNPNDCANETRATPPIIWGVRWNDDPPFRMKGGGAQCKYDQTIRANTQPSCWYQLFTHAEKQAAKGEIFGPGHALLYRTHFGDLQFLHAMASLDNEPASVTKKRIMMWAEFMWGITAGTLRRDTYISTLGINELGRYFPGEQSASILLSLGYPAFQNEKVAEVALGSLLHLLQDSFSRAHVTRGDAVGADCPGIPNVRAPGAITQFHSYANQNHSTHDAADRPDALQVHVLEITPSVIDASRAIVGLWKSKAAWQEAKQYLDCVFTLSPSAQNSGPGEGFSR